MRETAISVGSQEIPVHIADMTYLEDRDEQVLQFPPFRRWVERNAAFLTIRQITIQSVDFFGPRVGFMKVKGDFFNSQGEKVPGIALLTGGTIVLFVILSCEGEEYVVLVEQTRSAIGSSSFLELPAGMVDNHSFRGAAAMEIKEETGLEFREEEMIDLTAMVYGNDDPYVYFSAGRTDEKGKVYYVRRNIKMAEVNDLRGRIAGAQDEHERTFVHLVPFRDLIRATRDSKALFAAALYCQLIHNSSMR